MSKSYQERGPRSLLAYTFLVKLKTAQYETKNLGPRLLVEFCSFGHLNSLDVDDAGILRNGN